MKKRIIIALLILIVLAAVGLSLYLFVFKERNMSRETAANFVSRIAIDIEAIEDYEGSPNLEDLNINSGNDTIIKTNPLPAIEGIELINNSLTTAKINEGTDSLKEIILEINSFLNTEKAEPNKVYQRVVEYTTTKYFYKTINNEITLTKKIIEGENVTTSYLSIIYDSKDNEYEIVRTTKYNNSSYTFTRYKLNSNEILSVENYNLIDIVNEDAATAVKNGEGTSLINISDFKNQTYKSVQLNKSTSADNHLILSSYIYQAYSNFNEKLSESIELIDKETKPTVIGLLP